MADIITLEEKLRIAKAKQTDQEKKKKILAVRQAFQCTRCAAKCIKCGTQIGMADQSEKGRMLAIRTPYRFCENCAREYVDYVEHLKGEGDPDCYWHNTEWMELWRRWIDFQSATDRYLKSKEFMQLLDDIRQIDQEDD